MTRRWWLLAVAPCLVAFGPYRPATLGAASLGMADAQLATGVGVVSLSANPANLAAQPVQVVEAGASRDGQGGLSSLHAGVVDATSSWGLAAGLAYDRALDWTFDHGLRQGQDVRAGLALGVNNEAGRLTIGASARWLSLDVPAVKGQRHLNQWTGDVGVAAAIRGVRLGATVRQVLSPDAAELPRRLAVGVGWADANLLVEANASWGLSNPTPATGLPATTGPIYRGGVGYQVGDEGLQIRAGFAHDASRPEASPLELVCAGLGWHTTAWALDGSVGADVAGSGTWMSALTLSFVLPQQSE